MTKYSIKNICLGIGIGLVFASVANISAAPKSLTTDEIRREAAKHSLIVMDAKDLIQKQPEQQTSAPQDLPKQGETTIVVIEPGATSDSISELLLSNKLIENKETFLSRLSQLKKESKMQIGTFTIPAGASIDEIIEIITILPR